MIICLGEAVADLVATGTGSLASPRRSFRLAAGGAPANVAVAAALLEARVLFLGKVGADPFGAYLAESIVARGVRAEIRVDEARPTPLAFVSLGEEGEREFFFHPARPAYLELTAAEVEEVLSKVPVLDCFHFGGLALADDPSRAATLRGAEVAARRGATVSFDPNWRPSLWRDEREGRQRLLEGAAAAHWVKMNEAEALFLSQRETVEGAAAWFLERGARLAVITKGPQGAYFARPGDAGAVPGYPVRAVDATGAGDAFMGAMLHGLTEWSGGRTDLEDALARANAAGALTTLRRGAIPAFPAARRLAKFLGRG